LKKTAWYDTNQLERLTIQTGSPSANNTLTCKMNTITLGDITNTTQFTIGSSNVAIGKNSVTTSIGEYNNDTIFSTTNIGVANANAPNVINIGTGFSRSNITIGSAVDRLQSTTINGSVTFTGDVGFQAGGGAFSIGDFMDQMTGYNII